MTAKFETLLYEVADGIGILTINRPKAMNSVNDRLLEETYVALEMMEKDPAVKAIIITGGDKVFAAGADIKAVSEYNAFEARAFIDLVHKTIFKLEDNQKPTIAAICGFALGGGTELALACDVRIAADNATFGLPEISLGIYPGGGGTQRLPRLIGLGRAKELIFTGDFFPAQRAYEMGMINQLVPADQVMDAAKKLARKLTKKPPLALRLAKSAINASMNTDIKSGCRLEQEGFAMLFASADQKEGMGAFLEGRKANFQGK
ncbi:MAG: enoyl-CoA hydratase/isomerase family protein [Solirubrobacterales bacterium]